MLTCVRKASPQKSDLAWEKDKELIDLMMLDWSWSRLRRLLRTMPADLSSQTISTKQCSLGSYYPSGQLSCAKAHDEGSRSQFRQICRRQGHSKLTPTMSWKMPEAGILLWEWSTLFNLCCCIYDSPSLWSQERINCSRI